jgi:hypothetical protein
MRRENSFTPSGAAKSALAIQDISLVRRGSRFSPELGLRVMPSRRKLTPDTGEMGILCLLALARAQLMLS